MRDMPFPDAPRVDARDKVRGVTLFAADQSRTGMVHAALAVATIGRGRITSLETRAAAAVPGVLLVVTHENIGDVEAVESLFGGGYSFQSLQPMRSPVIAYRGQPIALVAAETLEAAIEAAALVRALYERQPISAIFDAPGALTIAQAETPLSRVFKDVVFGDADKAFTEAPVKIDAKFTSPPQHQNPMELISTLAEWKDGKLTIFEGTQNAEGVRHGVATQLGVAPDLVEVVSPYTGGGFGQKNSLQMQTALVAIAAQRLQRPVKLVVPRAQIFHDASFRPASRHRIRLGADRSGKMVAAIHEVDSQTSRHDLFPARYAELSARLHGFDNFRGRERLVRTDVQTPGFMRGPWEHVSAFAMESSVDELAYRLGVDPVALRLANDTAIDPISNLPLSSRHVAECLERGAERFGWNRRTMAPESMRAEDGSFIGWGVAVGAYGGNTAPAVASISARDDGRVFISIGVHEMGQGVRTALASAVGRKLGVPPEAVVALIGDTNYGPQHLTAGSWGTATAIPAAEDAADAMLKALEELSPNGVANRSPAEILKAASRQSLEVQIHRKAPGQPDAIFARLASGKPSSAGPVYPGFTTFSYIAHFVEVRVEPTTRRVRVSRVVSIADCGRVISPRMAASQVRGGVVWGIGAALRETSEVDPKYGGFLNADLADYIVPVNADIVEIQVDFIDKPDTRFNDAGVKGLGEVAMVGVAPAIANAIYHATGRRMRDLPIRIEHLL